MQQKSLGSRGPFGRVRVWWQSFRRGRPTKRIHCAFSAAGPVQKFAQMQTISASGPVGMSSPTPEPGLYVR